MKYTVQIKRHVGYGSYMDYYFEADDNTDAICKISAHLDIPFTFAEIIEENKKRKEAGKEILTLTEIFDRWQDDEERTMDEILFIRNDSNGNMLFMKQETKKVFEIEVRW